jgi:hypothetical protein
MNKFLAALALLLALTGASYAGNCHGRKTTVVEHEPVVVVEEESTRSVERERAARVERERSALIERERATRVEREPVVVVEQEPSVVVIEKAPTVVIEEEPVVVVEEDTVIFSESSKSLVQQFRDANRGSRATKRAAIQGARAVRFVRKANNAAAEQATQQSLRQTLNGCCED